jgi:hypothetical protein
MPNAINTDGKRLGAQEFSYDWSINYNPVLADSGFGKNYFIYKNSYLDDSDQISVKTSSLGGLTSEKSVAITINQPVIIFYEDSPLLGPKYEHALTDNQALNKNYLIIKAEPYFFSSANIAVDPDANLQWSINGQPTQPQTSKNELLFSFGQNESGQVKLALI